MRVCLWGSSGAILCVSGSDVEMETLALLILPFKVDPQLTDRQSVQIFISRVSRDLISRHVLYEFTAELIQSRSSLKYQRE